LMAKPVETYELKKDKTRTILLDRDGERDKEMDISYLQDYMSLNLDEYQMQESGKNSGDEYEHKYASLEEKLASVHRVVGDTETPEDDFMFKKTLYRLNLRGELIYFFLEDFGTLAEIDEIIITHFMNKDILDILEKVGVDV